MHTMQTNAGIAPAAVFIFEYVTEQSNILL